MPDQPAAAVLVRPTRAEDVPAVIRLTQAVAAEGRWIGTEAGFDPDERAARILATTTADDRASFVAVAEGADGTTTVIGNLGIERHPYGVAGFGMLVAVGWRGRGVGRSLLDAGLDWARAAGAHKVELQVWPHNAAAIALYRRAGFVEEGRLVRHYPRANGELWDAVVMGLVLDHDRPGSPHGG